MESILERHAQEQKNLTSKIISLRKSVPKSDKRKKRQVNSDIADLEYELKTRHEREIKEWKAKEQGIDLEHEENELDDGISLDRLNELSVKDEPEENAQVAEQPKSKKVNKAKLRLEKRNAEMERLRQEAMEEAENQVDQGAVETAELTKLLTPMKLRIRDITADGHW
ncbi:hypothetical protein K501DRAFT_192135 [Backusella circina FSU 941]|nr:hypothetical protein K501DRAFT_192135 [Backusella circina FSU 941]